MRSSPYYVFLQETAARLAKQYGQVAVPIGRIAFDHGVHIERSKKLAKFKAHMIVPECNQDWVRVILPEGRRFTALEGPSNYDRFCVAHELAHLLIYREFSISPLDRTSYWKHEYLCDEFARMLLVPKPYIDNISEKEMDALALKRVADTVKIPIMHAARRITQALPSTTFFQLEKQQTGEWKIVSSSLELAKETGRLLQSILSLYIEKFSQADTLVRTWIVDGSTLQRSNLGSFAVELSYKANAMKYRGDAKTILISISENASIDDIVRDAIIPTDNDLDFATQREFLF